MFEFLKKTGWRINVLIGLVFFLLLCLAANKLINKYFDRTIDSNWGVISSEKNKVIVDACSSMFEHSQKQTNDFSNLVKNDNRFMSAFSSQNPRKTYDAFFEIQGYEDFNTEVYNTRLELFIYSGRQLFPDILELQRALKGERFTSIKESGFYTYLLQFEPMLDSSSENKSGPGAPGIYKASGVLVVGKLIDVNYKINNSFFTNYGLSQEIKDEYDLDASIENKPFSESTFYSEEDTAGIQRVDLKGIDGSVIARLIVPGLDKHSYIEKVDDDFQKLFSIIVFCLDIFIFIIIIYYSRNLRSHILKFSIYSSYLILSRYLWLIMGFPSNIFQHSLFEVFSPSHYASGFGYGIGKSLGELFITAMFIVAICFIILSLSLKIINRNTGQNYKIIKTVFLFLFFIISLVSLQIYGAVIQSLVFDSNLKYFDRSQIISLDHPELIFGQFIILLLSISLILVLISFSSLIFKYNSIIFNRVGMIKRSPYLQIIIYLGGINLLMLAIQLSGIEFSVSFWNRNLILVLVCMFSIFLYNQLMRNKSFKITSSLNFSIIALMCIIFIPLVLLTKITSQENKYLELIARKVSENEEDRINSMILTTLDDVADNKEIEPDLLNKNKYPKLAFNIWSQSILFSEDLNSGVFVLDPDKRLISDFNINPDELNSDSVIRNSVITLDSISGKQIKNSTEIDNDDESNDFESDYSGNGSIYRNKDLKFFYGIKPIEKINLKNSNFNKVIGFIVIAVRYDSKNFYSQAGIQILSNLNRDNLINKLTSSPEISEFSNGELIGSTNKDISRSFSKSLEPFKESVADKTEKTSLRFDSFENQLYKSFYLLADEKKDTGESEEKIYIVSLKANDFSMMAFFFFKFLLFIVCIFITYFIVYVIYRALYYFLVSRTYKTLRFGFREKIFVSFIIVSVIPIIVLALYSREFVKQKNNDFYKSQIISDLKIVEQYIKHRSPPIDFSKLRMNKSLEYYNLQNIFSKEFTEFHKNFNLYIYNKLVSTTDEQLYKSDLLDDRISGEAYYNIALNKKDYFSDNNRIGNLSVIAGYIPIYDNYNNLLGILSSQTVFRQNEINQELTENLVYIFGVYFVAVIFLIIIVNILSYTISNPIIRLQRATDQLSKGNIEIEVKSSSKDEIGDLISSFNKMTKELKRSREELKRVERESAWKDIARQVAHEIKNPLTPMKLAMQHLYYAYTHDFKDFKTVIQTTNRLIIDQIETLNRIATEFSDFAKMPSRNYIPLDINTVLCDAVKLLNTDNKINIDTLESKPTPIVIGDRDEVMRALINIIRNSLQAIDEKVSNRRDGTIKISSYVTNLTYSIKIRDNGIGMDEQTLQKLFEPYFSTKSSGMGLGLVITKKIIGDMGGRIFVKSEENVGTEVEIVLKLYNGN